MRRRRLLAAESAVLGAGGCVVRLAGLYHARRGAHTFFLKAGRVERWGGYTVNLLHYEDAALLTAAVGDAIGAKSPLLSSDRNNPLRVLHCEACSRRQHTNLVSQ